jgi:ribose transport system substrate-binding protein
VRAGLVPNTFAGMLHRIAALSLALLFAGCGGGGPELAIVTNSASPFWTLARRGAERELRDFPEFALDFQILQVASATEQKRILDDLVSRGVAGIAISPYDPVNQVAMLDAAAERCPLICTDSDAPGSRRVCYVGTDNVAAGQQAGSQIRAALPEGGRIVAFVGSTDAQNAVDRLRGIREALEGSEITIAAVMTDETDRVRAKSNVLDAMNRDPELGALVGIWSYNGPAILAAVRERGMLGQIPIICFDEEEETLQGVADGHVVATIVQQPYEFGRHAIRILAQLTRGDRSGIPPDGLIHVPTELVTPQNVAEFRTRLQAQLQN